MGKFVKDQSMASEAPFAPITALRKVRDDLEEKIPKPYLARAMVALDTEYPHGREDHDSQNMSVLQQHVAFFDLNKDGIIHPWETFMGLRRIGFNIAVTIFFTVSFHMLFSFPTLPTWIPSLLFPIYIENIHKGKHGSDTGVYDTEGRFVPVNFENMFSKYARTAPDKVTFRELLDMTEGNRDAYDAIGWVVSKVEWGTLYALTKDDEGFVSKESFRSVFDGSLFENLAKKNKEKQAKSSQEYEFIKPNASDLNI